MISEVSLQHALQAWTRRQSGTWREADEQELQAWLSATAEHREAYEKVARAWSKAGDLKHYLTDDLRREYKSALHRSAPSRRSAVTRTALAACLALLSIGVGIALWPATSRWWNGTEISLASAKGQTKSFALEDGTQVLLDADSQLVVHIGYHSRKASLVRVRR